ncbi:hypothetical protein [Brevibacillus sp. 179-C9.3 HS]|uniref:hypothetical protein n=1 Tax=unclassified Brevibacillus TaxID=2684853 RepID=UPI00399F54DB
MLIQVNKIDQEGFFLEPVLFDAEQVKMHDAGAISLGIDIVSELIPEGMYKPKWNGLQWEEGLTQQEIDAIKSKPTPPTELEIIGQQMVEKELQIMGLQSVNSQLGKSIENLEQRLSQGGL